MLTPVDLGFDAKNDTLLHVSIDQWLLESSAPLNTTKRIFRHINNRDARLWVTSKDRVDDLWCREGSRSTLYL